MKINYFYIIFLTFSYTILSCQVKEREVFKENCTYDDGHSFFSDDFMPDSIYVLLPSIACSECLVSSKKILNSFHNKEKLKFIVIPNGNVRNSRIIYSKEFGLNEKLVLDSSKIYSNYVKDSPQNIWLMIYKGICFNTLEIKGGMEGDLIKLLKKM